jgi:UDP-3-O-[3-hydroxymyristoyl] glucosamine N-acyltransferase
MSRTISYSSIVAFIATNGIDALVLNSSEIFVLGVNNPFDALQSELIFIGEERMDLLEIITTTKSELIITSKSFFASLAAKETPAKNFIFVDNPRFVFSLIFNHFFEPVKDPFISTTSVISKSSVIGKNVTIRDFVVIEEDCVIGDNCYIDSNVTIKRRTKLGNGVKIYPGAVLGSDGFGFIKDKDQTINFPHIAGVHIHDFAEIGSNTVIDRGALTNTIIGAHTKVDNLCHIAHNVEIGKNCYIIANSMIGGSTKIADNSWIAPSASLRDGLKIGKNVTVGIGAVVTKSIPDSSVWAGNPARPMAELKAQIEKINNL